MSDKGIGVESIQATGLQSIPDRVVYQRNLTRGQFTSPVMITRDWCSFVGWVANDDAGVRVLILDGKGALHEVVHPGKKPEGPGLTMEIIGDDLCYVITEHDNVATSPRLNAVVAGKFAGLAAPPAHEGFSDVLADHWAFPYVSACARRGIISGTGGGRFSPGNSMTRAQFCKVLALAMGWVDV